MNAQNNDLIPMGAPSMDFPIVMRGYERNHVNDAIRSLEDDLRTIMTERDQALAQVTEEHTRVEKLAAELHELKTQLRDSQTPTFETMGGRIASMLRLAEEEASEIRRAAEAEAEQIRAGAVEAKDESDRRIASDRAAADQYAGDRRTEADEVLRSAQAEAAELLESHRKQAEEHLATTQADAARLLAESEARRTEAEEDFKITLDARRSAAQADEAERDRASREDAANRIQASRTEADEMLQVAYTDASLVVTNANERARSLVEQAEDEVNRLQSVRAALAQQIAQVGQIVAQVPAYLAKAPEALAADRDVDAPRAAEPRRPDLFADGRADHPAPSSVGAEEQDVEPSALPDVGAGADDAESGDRGQDQGIDAPAAGLDPAANGTAPDALHETQALHETEAEVLATGDPAVQDVGGPVADDIDAEPTSVPLDGGTGATPAPTSARGPRVLSRRGERPDSDGQPESERTVEVSAIKQRRPRR